MASEIIQCPLCKRYIDANHDDPGTYYCERCYPTHARMSEIDPTQLRGMLLKIYYDAQEKLRKYKNENAR